MTWESYSSYSTRNRHFEFTLLAFGMSLESPHRISRRRPFDPSTILRQAQGTGSASATPPQGGSNGTANRDRCRNVKL